MKIFHGRSIGFYIRANDDCGEGSEIRIDYVQECEPPINFVLSPKQAIALAKEIIKVAEEYKKTGKQIRPRQPQLVYDDKEECD